MGELGTTSLDFVHCAKFFPPSNAFLVEMGPNFSNFYSYAISQMPSLIREARLPGCLGERKSVVQHLS
jgi:hypothetical protein